MKAKLDDHVVEYKLWGRRGGEKNECSLLLHKTVHPKWQMISDSYPMEHFCNVKGELKGVVFCFTQGFYELWFAIATWLECWGFGFPSLVSRNTGTSLDQMDVGNAAHCGKALKKMYT